MERRLENVIACRLCNAVIQNSDAHLQDDVLQLWLFTAQYRLGYTSERPE